MFASHIQLHIVWFFWQGKLGSSTVNKRAQRLVETSWNDIVTSAYVLPAS